VKTLVEKELAGGNHSTHWNGADNQGNSVPSGLYFYRLQTSQDVITRRMILLK
jgi:flagellar hook assembly protein FlgD